MKPDDPLDDLVSFVGDGASVDWDLEETRGGSKPGAVRALRDVARMADFNRALQRSARERENPAPSDGDSAPSSDMAPARWGGFTLLERVGAGSTGEVWRGWDSSLHREVAIKFLMPPGSGDPGRSDSLVNEARALARVRHPGVAAVYGMAEHDGRAGMWMEFLRGPTLEAEIERAGTLSVEEVARIGAQLCAALEALDQAGLVHRDIKPSNIVLEPGGRIALADFGLGWRRRLLAKESPRRGSGTPLFMAPSLLAGGSPTPRTDLYALGVTLRWALTGRTPFRARTTAELEAEAIRGPAEPLATERPDAPAGLIAAIEAAMGVAMNPAYTAAEMRRAMQDLLGARESPGGHPRAGVRGGARPSIAVLPFLNRGADRSDDYFADGLAEEMIAVLSGIRDFHVAARTSSFQFQGKNEDLAAIGNALQVETVLEGSVRKSTDRVRISVRLVKVADGHLLWSETYDRTLGDIFALQDEVAARVVEEVRSALLHPSESRHESESVREEVADAVRGRAQDPEAHRLFLQARHALSLRTPDGIRQALGLLQEAVERDPGYAQAWAELGSGHADGAHFGISTIEEGYGRARVAVTRALELDPGLAEGHARLARIQVVHDRDWLGAEASFLRALDRNPNNAYALNGAAVLLQGQGRLEEAITLFRRAVAQDPLHSAPHNNLGAALYESERWTEAEGPLRRALELFPGRYGTHSFLAQVLLEQGRAEEALAELALEPDEEFRLAALARVHHRIGNTALSDAALEELTAKLANESALQIAEVHGARGDADAAFHWLERAYAQRDVGLAHIKPSLHFRAVRSDPRWRAFLKKVGVDS
jgi:TolB-like protein/Tfp pilus assembly protein PilF